jgi:hypothetical protein
MLELLSELLVDVLMNLNPGELYLVFLSLFLVGLSVWVFLSRWARNRMFPRDYVFILIGSLF